MKRRLTQASLFLSLAIGTGVAAQEYKIDVIAAQHDQIPGTNDHLSYFEVPIMNNVGDVAFKAGHLPNPGYSPFPECIMHLDGFTGLLTRLVDTGDQMPNGRGNFSSLTPSALLDDGSLVFIGGFYTPPTPPAANNGVYRVHPLNGSLTEIAFESDQVSSVFSFGENFERVSMATNGATAFHAPLVAPNSFERGIFRSDMDGQALFARTGGIAPGIGKPTTSLDGPSMNATGDMAYIARSLGTYAPVPQVLYKTYDESVTTIGSTYDRIAGNAELRGFYGPTINDHGMVACTASIQYPIDSANYSNHVIMSGGGGGVTPVTLPSMPAPGGGDFKWSELHGLNNQNDVVFLAAIDTDPGEATGLFLFNGVEYLQIARTGQHSPRGGVFTRFGTVAMNEESQVLFTSFVNVSTQPHTHDFKLTLQFWDKEHGLTEIIRDGDPLAGDIITPVVGLQIAGFNDGIPTPPEGDSIGGRGSFAFKFRLSGGREGIASTTVVLPPRPQTDLRLFHALDPEVATPSATGDPSFSQSANEYLSDLDEVYGIAADGVATIALAYTTDLPGDANFVIESFDGLNEGIGSLQALTGAPAVILADGSQVLEVATQPVGNGMHAAVALLRAPEEYMRPSAPADQGALYRAIRATVYQGSSSAPDAEAMRSIRVTRPPVVLVHGLWASPATWDIAPDIRGAGFWVGLVDYEATNAASFDVNDDIVAGQIWQFIEKYREQTGSSAAQAIVGCHSMGGVLTRRVIAGGSGGPYRSYLNRGEGTIDRLITIATPHYGGAGARLLVLPDGTPLPILADLVSILEGCVTCGAVRDLHPESLATRSLPSTLLEGVPTHAISGSAGRDWIALGDVASEIIGTKTVLERFIQYFSEVLEFYQDITFGLAEHDMVVTLESQRGGLQLLQTTDFGFEPFPLFAGTHTGLPDEMRVADAVIDLFHLPFGDPKWAAGLPSVPPPTLPFFGGPSVFTDAGGLIISILGGRGSVEPGDEVHIDVAGFGEFAPDSITVVSTYDTEPVNQNGLAILDIPFSAPEGPIEITALGRNKAGELVLSETLTIDVATPGTIESFRVSPASVSLTSSNSFQLLKAFGFYTTGQERELNPTVHDIVFMSDDDSIVTVDSRGVITATGIGHTSITATTSGIDESFTVSVAVSADPLEPIYSPADLTGDGVVDTFDLAQLLAQWGGTGTGDLNDDGIVDTFDLAIVLAAWD